MGGDRTPPRVHPDVLAERILHSAAGPQLAAVQYGHDHDVYAARCWNCPSVISRWREQRDARTGIWDIVPVCAGCGARWNVARVADPRLAPSDDTGHPWDYELQMDDTLKLGVIKGVADAMLRADPRTSCVWPARCYFPYVQSFAGVPGKGMRGLLLAHMRRYPRAPFLWTLKQVHALVHEGRERWSERLADLGVIAPRNPDGSWWWA